MIRCEQWLVRVWVSVQNGMELQMMLSINTCSAVHAESKAARTKREGGGGAE